MSVVLLTGFEPFRDFKTNPSQHVVQRLDGTTVGSAQIVGLVLPVAYGADTSRLFSAIEEWRPQLVLSLGLSAGAPCLHVERIAINVLRTSDDTGTPILPDGPAAYFATVDVDHIVARVAAQGIPVQAHVYAGSYMCNHIMYQTLHFARERKSALRSGFIHVPLSSEQALAEKRLDKPSLPLETITAGVVAAIEAAGGGDGVAVAKSPHVI